METVDAVVIGAGVVGLAAARALAEAGREVLILEAAEAIGTGTSARNSEVIHAGLYYPPGSLKGRLCVAGRDALYAYCAGRGVAHRRCGKLIVATDEAQVGALHDIERAARGNGVRDLRWLEADAIGAMEPALRAVKALHSPSTGIVDSHGLMLALLADAEARGAVLALRSPVRAGRCREDGIELEVGGDEPMQLRARAVVNSAGLDAQAVAASLEGMPPSAIPRRHLARGHYFTLSGRSPFAHLIYPVPEPGGLGVHATLDLGGQVKFGPDVEWIDAIDYHVDPARAARFVAAVRRYWPGLPDDALQPGYAGIRPKLSGPGAPAADFRVDGPAVHGVPGLVHLYGIESPGLTACLALARLVLERLEPGTPQQPAAG